MRGRAIGTGLLAGAVVVWTCAAASSGGTPNEPAWRALVEQGEAALARGDAAQAVRDFERAGTLAHAAESEMGLVRAYMQAGAYRRALAFAAHTAGAHRDAPAGAVLYAWLLHVGGQTAPARRVLEQSEARAPGDALTAQARTQLRATAPVADGALLSAPWRVAPFDAGAPLPATARVTGTAVLVDGGRRAVAPLAALSEAGALWVRDGLGRRSAARLEQAADALGVALLRLETALDDAPALVLAPREPFAGSPAFALGYTAAPGGAPAWPLLRAGFFGLLDAPDGPVFDGGGRFAGVLVRGRDGRPSLLASAALQRDLGARLGVVAEPAVAPRMAADAIYEAALRVTLQVVAADH